MISKIECGPRTRHSNCTTPGCGEYRTTIAINLRADDVFSYVGSFAWYRVIREPWPDALYWGRIRLSADRMGAPGPNGGRRIAIRLKPRQQVKIQNANR